MRATIVLDLDVDSDQDVIDILERTTKSDQRIKKGNAYDPGQNDNLQENEKRFSLHFTRHIFSETGNWYQG